MKITIVGIDLAKNVFQIHGVDEHGKAVVRKQLKREQMCAYFANLPTCLIVMEAVSVRSLPSCTGCKNQVDAEEGFLI